MSGLRRKHNVKAEVVPGPESSGNTEVSPDRGADAIPPRSTITNRSNATAATGSRPILAPRSA